MARRAKLAAFGIAIALPAVIAGLIAFRLQPVLARADNIANFFTGEAEQHPTGEVEHHEGKAPQPRQKAAARGAFGDRSICVRLCDGYFFPLGNVSDGSAVAQQETQCSNLCPGAPTRLFLVPSGADTIENAASPSDGLLYSALPAAYRYTHLVDQTCTCRGEKQNELARLMTDITLRPGDVVVTQAGLQVYTGAGPRTPAAFVSFSQVQRPAGQAATLAAIASVLKQFQSESDDNAQPQPATFGPQ